MTAEDWKRAIAAPGWPLSPEMKRAIGLPEHPPPPEPLAPYPDALQDPPQPPAQQPQAPQPKPQQPQAPPAPRHPAYKGCRAAYVAAIETGVGKSQAIAAALDWAAAERKRAACRWSAPDRRTIERWVSRYKWPQP